MESVDDRGADSLWKTPAISPLSFHSKVKKLQTACPFAVWAPGGLWWHRYILIMAAG